MPIHGSLRALAIAAILVTTPLAGCLGSAQAATAQQEESQARDEAQTWADDAELASVVGIEGAFVAGFTAFGAGSADHWDRANEDDDIGDGRCKVWKYTFVSESKPDEAYFVVVDHEGEIVDSGTEDRDDQGPIGEWSFDSDEALDTAKDANEGLERGTSSENYGLVIVLDDDEDYENPTWFVAGGGGDSSGGGGGVVVVDAVTGDVLSSSGGYGSGDYGSGGWSG
jgi:hypothetical protein